MSAQRPAAAAEPPAEGLEPPVGDSAVPDDQAFGARIDGLLPTLWTDEMVGALDEWKQGDLLRGSPLFWLAPAGDDPVMGTRGHGGEEGGAARRRGEEAGGVGGADDGVGPETAADDRSDGGADVEATGLPLAVDAGTEENGWYVITSQTCDVAAAGPGAKHPVVSVSPVYRLPEGTSQNRLAAISRGEVVHLVQVTNPPGIGFYVVDLRLSMPVSKGVLLEQTPVDGWADEVDRIEFAEAVARKVRRPALHDIISNDMRDSLNTHIGSPSKTAPEWREKVLQVRLRVNGDRLRPTSVSLVICCDVKLTTAERAIWRSWQKQGKRILATAGIGLDPQLIQTMDEMNARSYQDSVPLHLPALGRPPAW